MTNQSSLKNHPEILEQFEKSVCLTYDYTMSDCYHEAQKNIQHKCGRIVSPTAKFSLSSDGDIAFFSDGSLYVEEFANPQMVENFKQWVAKQGYKVNVKIVSESFFVSDINRYACAIAQDKMIFEPLEDKETFVNRLFENNVCLSAVYPKLKSDILALFADGRLIVSEKYKYDHGGIYDYREVKEFQRKNREYFYRKEEYVPQEYIDAVYAKVAEQNPQPKNTAKTEKTQLTMKQKAEIDALVQEIYKNNNHCISVTFPFGLRNFMPDKENFILFANGELIIDEKQVAFFAPITAEAQKKCPSEKIRLIKVPTNYIEEIYKIVITKQKSAKEIYLEMLKQKAKKLGKKLSLPHHESLELVAHMSGWKNWKEVTNMDEKRARFAASTEKEKKEELEMFYHDKALEKEYEEYLNHK